MKNILRVIVIALSILLAADGTGCSQKAKVDRAFSSIQSEAVAGQQDLTNALDTGEVGPTAEPFRGLGEVTLREDGAGGRQRPFFNAESPGTGESADDAAHAGRVVSHPRWGDLPAVAYRAAGGDPRLPADGGPDGDPDKDAVGSGPRGGGVRPGGPGEAGDDRSAGGAAGDGGPSGDRLGIRRGVQESQKVPEKQGESIMTAITTAIVWGTLGFLAGTIFGSPVLNWVKSKIPGQGS